ncbi:MAG: hypothetical protein H6720_16835 [Sandaracinus sp.]|nr:hypothetical protein [Sandaracinus sp.]
MLRSRLLCIALLTAAACGDDDGPALDSGTPVDSGTPDGGGEPDAGQDGGVDAGMDAGPPGPPCAETLGLFADSTCENVQEGILAYSPRFWLWSDATDKDRYIQLPEDSVIDTSDPDRWIFPVGTKIWKTFSLDGMRLETRVMEKTASGTGNFNWQFRTYRWNEDQSSVTEVVDGEMNVLGTGHDIPAQAACTRCHGPAGGGSADAVLGFGTIQLAHTDTDTTLDTLDELGFLSAPVPASAGVVPGNAATVAALGYLHANCGHCHGTSRTIPAPGGGLGLWIETSQPLAEQAAYRTAVRTPANWRDPAMTRIPSESPQGVPSSSVFLRLGVRGRANAASRDGDRPHGGQRILETWIREGEFPRYGRKAPRARPSQVFDSTLRASP